MHADPESLSGGGGDNCVCMEGGGVTRVGGVRGLFSFR